MQTGTRRGHADDGAVAHRSGLAAARQRAGGRRPLQPARGPALRARACRDLRARDRRWWLVRAVGQPEGGRIVSERLYRIGPFGGVAMPESFELDQGWAGNDHLAEVIQLPRRRSLFGFARALVEAPPAPPAPAAPRRIASAPPSRSAGSGRASGRPSRPSRSTRPSRPSRPGAPRSSSGAALSSPRPSPPPLSQPPPSPSLSRRTARSGRSSSAPLRTTPHGRNPRFPSRRTSRAPRPRTTWTTRSSCSTARPSPSRSTTSRSTTSPR